MCLGDLHQNLVRPQLLLLDFVGDEKDIVAARSELPKLQREAGLRIRRYLGVFRKRVEIIRSLYQGINRLKRK